jgi:hypothetical protein
MNFCLKDKASVYINMHSEGDVKIKVNESKGSVLSFYDSWRFNDSDRFEMFAAINLNDTSASGFNCTILLFIYGRH